MCNVCVYVQCACGSVLQPVLALKKKIDRKPDRYSINMQVVLQFSYIHTFLQLRLISLFAEI